LINYAAPVQPSSMQHWPRRSQFIAGPRSTELVPSALECMKK
jgi:hypothetical protein